MSGTVELEYDDVSVMRRSVALCGVLARWNNVQCAGLTLSEFIKVQDELTEIAGAFSETGRAHNNMRMMASQSISNDLAIKWFGVRPEAFCNVEGIVRGMYYMLVEAVFKFERDWSLENEGSLMALAASK